MFVLRAIIVTMAFLFNFCLLILGVTFATVGIKGFLLPNHLIDGGIMGVALLLSELFSLSLPLLVVVINAPFLIAGYVHIGKRFFSKALIAICLLSVSLYLLPIPDITDDLLLVSVFGGLLLGLGIGLTLRYGGVLDGTEILGMFFHKRFGISIGSTIMGFNILLFSAASIVLSVKVVMYSILTYFAASKMVDFIVYGLDEYVGAYIISDEKDAIQDVLIQELGKGGTILMGKGAYTRESQEILFCVITRLEIQKLKRIIAEIDPKSFVFFNKISDVYGGKIDAKKSF